MIVHAPCVLDGAERELITPESGLGLACDSSFGRQLSNPNAECGSINTNTALSWLVGDQKDEFYEAVLRPHRFIRFTIDDPHAFIAGLSENEVLQSRISTKDFLHNHDPKHRLAVLSSTLVFAGQSIRL